MKTYKITNRMSQQAKNEIKRIIDTHEKYKKSYFWKPASSADNRRRNERKFIENNPPLCFIKGEKRIEVSMNYSESCKNVYYRLTVLINGEVSNITAVKNLLK